MNKNLRNLIGAIRCKTVLYANMAKAQSKLSILTDYTKPTVTMLHDFQFRSGVSMATFFRIEKEVNRIYEIEAQTEDYIRGVKYEAEIKKSH